VAVRVVKVGGSLFDSPGFPSNVERWLIAQRSASNVLVAGGGPLADAVRDLDRRVQLTASAAHWMAIRAMKLNGFVLSLLSPRLALTTSMVAVCQQDPARLGTILDAEHFLRHDEPALPGTPLPSGWEVTSDSIAARLAAVLRAGELVLLKSAIPSAANSLPIHDAAARGFVDAYFPIAAARLPQVRAVNLRDPAFPECALAQ